MQILGGVCIFGLLCSVLLVKGGEEWGGGREGEGGCEGQNHCSGRPLHSRFFLCCNKAICLLIKGEFSLTGTGLLH